MLANQTLTLKDKKVTKVEGGFIPNQASEILNALINLKTNYCRIKKLQHWKQDHKTEAKLYILKIKRRKRPLATISRDEE